jgi:protein TonB
MWATLVTVLLFMALPILERVSAPPELDIAMRSIQTTAVPPPPPPPPPVRPPEPVRRDAPKPHLERTPPRLQPLALALSLGHAMGGLQGDFFADFAVAGVEAALDAGAYVFEIAELDEPPRPLANLPPSYPAQAHMRRVEGHVTLEYIVAADGSVTGIQVTDSHPPGVFDRAAVNAVQRWRFHPGIRNGAAVSTRVQQRLNFQLE